MSRRRLAAIVIVSALLSGVLSIGAAFVFSQWATRRAIADVATSMKTTATAIEAYFVDNMQYPAMTMDAALDADPRTHPGPLPRTFRVPHDTGMRTLTTPIAYMATLPRDPFADSPARTLSYYGTLGHWIIGSFGPDRDQALGGQLGWADGDLPAPRPANFNTGVPEVLPDCALERINPEKPGELTAAEGPYGAFLYDPTNGLYSPGDIVRSKL